MNIHEMANYVALCIIAFGLIRLALVIYKDILG